MSGLWAEASARSVSRSGPASAGLGEYGILAALLALATALRLPGAWAFPFDQDELYTLRDALAFPESARSVRPLFFGIQRLALLVVPINEFGLRLPALFFGLAGVALSWWVVRRLFGLPAASVAGLLAALSPWHLYASHMARYWTLIFAVAALSCYLLERALETDSLTAYAGLGVTLLVGTLSHPSFAFVFLGVVLGAHFVRPDGRFGWRWPTRTAWLGCWGAMAVLGAAGLGALALAWDAVPWPARRAVPPWRAFAGMVQWTGVEVVAAAGLAVAGLLASARARDRRWGAMAFGGAVSLALLLAWASQWTAVYADYGMAAVFLGYAAVGVGVQRLSERTAVPPRYVVGGAALLLAVASAPGTVSHLRDGTRFDYRPALAQVRAMGPERVVVGWPDAVLRYYGSDLSVRSPLPRPDVLSGILQDTGGFWLVASYHRQGAVFVAGATEAWVRRHCSPVHVSEALRLDFRAYRVVLYACGFDPMSAPRAPARGRVSTRDR